MGRAPRVFTKIMKPVFSELRKFGHLNVIYINDVLLLGNTKNECEDNLKATIKSLDSLAFTIQISVSCKSKYCIYRVYFGLFFNDC